MKRYFMIALACILVLSVGIVCYGVWLNRAGENAILERMQNRTLALHGVETKVRSIRPMLSWPTVQTTSHELADAVARVDGIVEAIYVDHQSHVENGQLIMRLKNEAIPLKLKQEESDIVEAKATVARTYNSYQRQLSLVPLEAGVGENLDEAKWKYQSACAKLDNEQAKYAQLLVEQSRQSVEAPIAGDVLLLYRRVGTYVTAGTALALIGDFDQLHFKVAMKDADIRAMLPMEEEKDLFFQKRDYAKVYGTDYNAANKGEQQAFSVQILSVTPSLDVPADMRYVVWEIDNTSGILEPKTYSDITVQGRSAKDVLSVPLSAMTDASCHAVYVWNAERCLEYREVRTGIQDGTYIEIVEGLQPGDIVITSGMENLEAGMKADVDVEEAD